MQLYPFQRILVCTDFSDSSSLALKAAEELRQRNKGSIDLLHVSELGFELSNLISRPENYHEHVLTGIKNTLQEKINLQIKHCNAQATPLIKEGNIVNIVRQMADNGLYDLVVMGHGRSPLMSQLIGSTAYKMISSTPLPLLLIKTPVKFGRVAGLIDESRSKDLAIIATLDFAKKFHFSDASFISLWLDFPEPFGNQSEADAIKEEITAAITHYCPPSIIPDIHVGPTRELKLAVPLNRILTETKADVAVLKKFSEGNLKRAYIGSTSKKLLEIFNGNLLIIPPTSVND